jgi:hypothetical protein
VSHTSDLTRESYDRAVERIERHTSPSTRPATSEPEFTPRYGLVSRQVRRAAEFAAAFATVSSTRLHSGFRAADPRHDTAQMPRKVRRNLARRLMRLTPTE